jgi:hypothetical protein
MDERVVLRHQHYNYCVLQLLLYRSSFSVYFHRRRLHVLLQLSDSRLTVYQLLDVLPRREYLPGFDHCLCLHVYAVGVGDVLLRLRVGRTGWFSLYPDRYLLYLTVLRSTVHHCGGAVLAVNK